MRQDNERSQPITESEAEEICQKLSTGIFEPELVIALAHLFSKLKNRCQEFNIILSDDISGRPVAIILQKLINEQRAKQHLSPLEIIFVPAGRPNRIFNEEHQHDREKLLQNLQAKGIHKVLIATEMMINGGTAKSFDAMLKSIGVVVEIATPSILRNLTQMKEIEPSLAGRVTYGEIGTAGDVFHKIRKLVRVSIPELSQESQSHAPEKIGIALGKESLLGPEQSFRKDMDIVIQELAKRLL